MCSIHRAYPTQVTSSHLQKEDQIKVDLYQDNLIHYYAKVWDWGWNPVRGVCLGKTLPLCGLYTERENFFAIGQTLNHFPSEYGDLGRVSPMN